MKRILSFLATLVGLTVASCSTEASGSAPTNGLTVVIKKMRVFKSYTEFDLEVENHAAQAISVSQFSLATLLRTVKLSHTNGCVWQVERPKIIEDPPSTKEDFTFAIGAKGTNTITLATPLSPGLTL